MKTHRLEWALLILLVVGVALGSSFPPSGRPDDLDLQMEVRQVAPRGKNQQVEATVRWHWRRHPVLPLGGWVDGIGFVYDLSEWTELAEGNGINAEALLARYHEPRSYFDLMIPAGQDGERTFTFVSRRPDYDSPVMNLRIQFIHSNEDLEHVGVGWVKSLNGEWRLSH